MKKNTETGENNAPESGHFFFFAYTAVAVGYCGCTALFQNPRQARARRRTDNAASRSQVVRGIDVRASASGVPFRISFLASEQKDGERSRSKLMRGYNYKPAIDARVAFPLTSCTQLTPASISVAVIASRPATLATGRGRLRLSH